MQEDGKQRDVEEERYWRRVIREAARSRASIRRLCQQRRLRKSLFYWWQRELNKRQQARAFGTGSGSKTTKAPGQTTFALLSEESGESGASGIELVLRGRRRLRIGKGVDEQTLRTAVAVLEEGCSALRRRTRG